MLNFLNPVFGSVSMAIVIAKILGKSVVIFGCAVLLYEIILFESKIRLLIKTLFNNIVLFN